MPQPSKGPRLGGSPAHQKLMLANLATSLFTHGRIHTTRAKAERLRPYAERLITKAKHGDLHNRRVIAQQIRDKDVVHRLMAEIGPFFADRAGGYTRIIKTLPRKGDNAQMAIIELVNERTASAEASQATRVASDQGSTTAVGGTATGAAATAATIAASESDSEDTTSEETTSDASTSEETTSEETTSEETANAADAEDSVGTDSESPEVPEAEASAATADDAPAGEATTDASTDDDTVTDLVVEPEDKS